MTAIQLRTELFREMSPLLDNEPAMEKMLTFIRTLKPTKTAKSEVGWADRFAGAWKDDRTADEIISDTAIHVAIIRNSLVPALAADDCIDLSQGLREGELFIPDHHPA